MKKYIRISAVFGISLLVMLALLLSATVLSGCGKSEGPSVAKGGHHRQYIIVTLDTTRADHFGCYGSDIVKTPNFDALAGDAVLFENCFSSTHSTTPSHVSLFTSLHMKDHGVLSVSFHVPVIEQFMPKVFKAAGYRTAAFTSAAPLAEKSNINQGFDFFNAPNGAERSAGETNELVLPWLEDNSGSDFFLWVHYFDSHMEYLPPEPYDRMYSGESGEKVVPSAIRNPRIYKSQYADYLNSSDDAGHFKALYKGEASYLDSELGRLISKLKELGVYDDCTIIVIADHGESLGEHGIYWDHEGIYDTTIRVPLIIKLKGGVMAGPRSQIVSNLDVYPTLLELAGIECSWPVRGKSLIGIFNDPAAPEVHEEVFSQSVFQYDVSIRTHEYTYIRHMADSCKGTKIDLIKDPSGNQELYMAQADRAQVNNVVTSERELAARLNRKAIEFMDDRLSTTKAKEVTDKEQLEKLKALGYIQ